MFWTVDQSWNYPVPRHISNRLDDDRYRYPRHDPRRTRQLRQTSERVRSARSNQAASGGGQSVSDTHGSQVRRLVWIAARVGRSRSVRDLVHDRAAELVGRQFGAQQWEVWQEANWQRSPQERFHSQHVEQLEQPVFVRDGQCEQRQRIVRRNGVSWTEAVQHPTLLFVEQLVASVARRVRVEQRWRRRWDAEQRRHPEQSGKSAAGHDSSTQRQSDAYPGFLCNPRVNREPVERNGGHQLVQKHHG